MNAKTMRCALPGVFILIVVLAAGCAARGEPAKLTAAPGKKTVPMIASNFKFEPSTIEALKGDTLVFEITNASSTVHNFTIKDPGGRTIKSVDLPGNEQVSVEIALDEEGAYEFYCDKPFHPTMGMKGHVKALPH